MGKTLIFIIFLPVFINALSSFKTEKAIEGSSFERANTVKNYMDEDPKCTDCHSDLIEKGTKHPAALEDGCVNCHQININEHTQNGTKGLALADKMPDLCFACHDDIKNNITSLPVIHQAVNEKKFCVNCHSPHSSSEKKIVDFRRERALP